MEKNMRLIDKFAIEVLKNKSSFGITMPDEN